MENQPINPDAVEFDDSDEELETESYDFEDYSQFAISSSDWTTETILSQLTKNNIWLTPGFQRRDAWTLNRKVGLIESFILGLPIPQIVLAEKKGERGKFIVLDGKQRLLTLLQFTGSAEGKNNSFALKRMEILEEIEGSTYQDLINKSEFSKYLNAFLNHTMRAVVIKNWPSMSFLHLIFLRLNMGSVKLSPQELRQAMYPGEFSNFIDRRASDSDAIKDLLRLNEPDFRMRDIELLVRFLAFKNFLSDYNGNMKFFLDHTCELFNDEWSLVGGKIRGQIDEMELGIKALIEIFGDENVCRRPVEDGLRRPFNRAIFDALIFFISEKDIREKALKNRETVSNEFKILWRESQDFVSSVESTTKSITATFNRISLWGEALKNILKINISIPNLIENRIQF